MPAPRPFLTARWSNLCIVSYAVPRAVLEPHLPPGLTLDERDGQCFASLVAFDFLDTRVRGVHIPCHVNFPEVNLRFYVRQGDNRGVCFIREFVPRRAIAGIARAIYNEPYLTARMSSRVEADGDCVTIHHRFSWGAAIGDLLVTALGPPITPFPDSIEHFFKEHTWGFGMSRSRELVRYRVQHPVWAIHRVESYNVNIDWEGLYGPEWERLSRAVPVSVVLAVGSTIRVYPRNVDVAPE